METSNKIASILLLLFLALPAMLVNSALGWLAFILIALIVLVAIGHSKSSDDKKALEKRIADLEAKSARDQP